jgi:hypothetical protein
MKKNRKEPRFFRSGNILVSEERLYSEDEKERQHLDTHMLNGAFQKATELRLHGVGFSIRPQCFVCKHGDSLKRLAVPKCAAFSGYIPAEILMSEFDHRNPHSMDNGLRFSYIGENEADSPDPYTTFSGLWKYISENWENFSDNIKKELEEDKKILEKRKIIVPLKKVPSLTG